MTNEIEEGTHSVRTPQAETMFNFDGAGIPVLMLDGSPWFHARSVCDVLDIGNVSMAVQALDQDEKQQVRANVSSTDVGGRIPWVINESGLYSLILRSRKPEARRFKRWITHEVLPTIRKTGGYATPGLDLTTPDKVLEVMRASVEAHQRLLEDNAKLEVKVVELTPKAGRYDAFMNTDETKSIREVARMLKPYGIREREFIDDHLRDLWSWIDRHGTAAKVNAVDQGYMVNKVVYKPTGETVTQGRLTKKGIEAAFRKLGLGVLEEVA
ncbi:BRO family protein [Nonomuraea jabiensis]|uniref:BRO family protein n=1 Tax=Nonomuraea jabiensis TaxID=882448 RepID=UPI003D74730C